MTDHPIEPTPETPAQAAPPPPPKRGCLRRFGCYLLVILWFLFLLTPCLLFSIASSGQILIPLGDAPDQAFRLWVVEEIRERGIAISRPAVIPGQDENSLCVQTDVTFMLWLGSAEPISYCNCYQRPQPESDWSVTSTSEGLCP